MNTLECIKTRHSTRKFKADQLSRELIDQDARLLVATLRLVAIHN